LAGGKASVELARVRARVRAKARVKAKKARAKTLEKDKAPGKARFARNI
jgi:hypothetical protein